MVGAWSHSHGMRDVTGDVTQGLYRNDFTDFGGGKLLIGSQEASTNTLAVIVDKT